MKNIKNLKNLTELIGNFDPDLIPRPIGWRILVKPDEISDTYAGSGIIKPESTQVAEKYQTSSGTLIAVGDCYTKNKHNGMKFHYQNADIGDYVVFGKWSGQFVRCTDPNGNWVEFKLLNDDEILAIVKRGVKVETYTSEMLHNA